MGLVNLKLVYKGHAEPVLQGDTELELIEDEGDMNKFYLAFIEGEGGGYANARPIAISAPDARKAIGAIATKFGQSPIYLKQIRHKETATRILSETWPDTVLWDEKIHGYAVSSNDQSAIILHEAHEDE